MTHTLTHNGVIYKRATTRAQCLIVLERARSRAAIAGLTWRYTGTGTGAILSLSNGDFYKMEEKHGDN